VLIDALKFWPRLLAPAAPGGVVPRVQSTETLIDQQASWCAKAAHFAGLVSGVLTSLLSLENSLILKIYSLIFWIGNCAKTY
jgi:hypothetical protein